MKSIRKELLRNNLILILCAGMFIGWNMISYMTSFLQDNKLLSEYQQIHELVLLNNQRKTSFKLYCKSHDEGLWQVYDNDCDDLNRSLKLLAGKMQRDNNCKMMFRLVCQVLEHSKLMAARYADPSDWNEPDIVNYLDEIDLELERCINLLINYYLEYLNETFTRRNGQMQLVMLLMNGFLVMGGWSILMQSREVNERILKSVETLSEAAKEIINKNFDSEDIREMEYEELEQVSGTFNLMKHTIRSMLEEIHEKHQMKQRLAEAKVKELQMQMNPHFLFNSLSLVVRNIQVGDKDTSIQLIRAISRILRTSIEIKTTQIPLDDELELLESYLYIQRLHMRGRVTFYLDVRKSFGNEDFLIPPLTIQPLVENSVQHGLKDKIKDGRVEILVTEKADYMEVVVADNGVGFQEDAEKLLMLDDTEKSNRQGAKTSIGLRNVKERLTLFYRREDVMSIERADGMTRITLKLYKNEKRTGEKEDASFNVGR